MAMKLRKSKREKIVTAFLLQFTSVEIVMSSLKLRLNINPFLKYHRLNLSDTTRLFVYTIFILILFCSCANKPSQTQNEPVDDSLKNIPEKYHGIIKKFESKSPQRIISIAPSTTELLYEYGVGEYLVGATIPHDYPPEAVDLPSIGDMSLDFERIIALQPDLLIGEGNLFAGMIDNIKDLGIPVLLFDTRSNRDLSDNLLVFDKLFKRDDGEKLNEGRYMGLTVNRNRNPKTRPRVAPIISSTPLILAAGDSWLVNLIKIAGGKSITSDTPGDYITLSREDMILLNPDVIICTFEGTRNDLLLDETLANIEAIKNDRVFYVDPDIILRPTLRSIGLGSSTLRDLFLE